MLVKILIISLFVLLKPLALKADNRNWAHWRGPNANGVVPSAKPPTHWSEKKMSDGKCRLTGQAHLRRLFGRIKSFFCQ